MNKKSENLQAVNPAAPSGNPGTLDILIMSFGYKEGPPPSANVVFDVRFLKNPYWVEELRPLTGLDKPIQDYVLQQELAQEFLDSAVGMMKTLLPRLVEMDIKEFSIAFGCTGGQHRSATLVEVLSNRLQEIFPHFNISKQHRELPETCGSEQTVAEG